MLRKLFVHIGFSGFFLFWTVLALAAILAPEFKSIEQGKQYVTYFGFWAFALLTLFGLWYMPGVGPLLQLLWLKGVVRPYITRVKPRLIQFSNIVTRMSTKMEQVDAELYNAVAAESYSITGKEKKKHERLVAPDEGVGTHEFLEHTESTVAQI